MQDHESRELVKPVAVELEEVHRNYQTREELPAAGGYGKPISDAKPVIPT
jgi:hypothetical protein